MNYSESHERMNARLYLRKAASAGPLLLTDAMAYPGGIGHGRVARRRLDALVAAGHVAPDALTGWAA